MPGLKPVALPTAVAAAFGASVCVYLYQKELPTMFLLHVVGMSLAFLAAGPIGVFVQKVPGNTALHGTCMGVGFALAAGGYYGIYAHKNNIGKPHVVTVGMDPLQDAGSASWHALLGALVVVGWMGILGVGKVFLDPDCGVARHSKALRMVHRNSGKLMICLALVVCALGWNKLHGSAPNMQYAFGAGAATVGLAAAFFVPSKPKKTR